MQLIVDIKNKSIADKIVRLLKDFKDKGVEIREIKKAKQETEFSDEYIEKNWLDIIRKAHVPEDYENSEQYMEDRVKDWEERGKI